MSWIFRKSYQPQQPDTTSHEQARDKQVQSLKKQVQLSTGVVHELTRHVQYRVDFAVGNLQMRLMIHLPPEFPRFQPKMQVDPPVAHSWVDTQMNVVGCKALNEFRMHSVLGNVVLEIINEFRKNPPQLSHAPYPFPPPTHHHHQPQYRPPLMPNTQPYPNPGYSAKPQVAMPTPLSSNTTHQPTFMPLRPAPAPPPVSHRTSQHTYNVPEVPTNFPELKDLSIDELEEFNSKEEKVHSFIANLAAVKKLQDDQAELNDEIESQAKINLEKEPELQEKIQKLTEQHETLAVIKDAVQKVQQKHQEACKTYSDSAVLANLAEEVKSIDELSETVAEQFLSGELDSENFIKQFTDKRTMYHCRKAKEEKLQKSVGKKW
ncbi:vacuolar protein sorting-associated protein 37A-like [Corticium candelabrum]|uniref:vacuolar protein sorting-associated protein 37A-like n=1 Tax=Corticium candelabrum TaxID=121492 RepID=UPI002E265E2E|nr:vacuolar protein sorting-associated protein 37A-like [Corticium candelabrum]